MIRIYLVTLTMPPPMFQEIKKLAFEFDGRYFSPIAKTKTLTRIPCGFAFVDEAKSLEFELEALRHITGVDHSDEAMERLRLAENYAARRELDSRTAANTQ